MTEFTNNFPIAQKERRFTSVRISRILAIALMASATIGGINSSSATSNSVNENKPYTTIDQSNKGEFALIPQMQRYDYDCGHTVLDMLGYDGHNIFPKRAMKSSDWESIPGVVEVTVPVGLEEQLDYSVPVIWTFLPKAQFQSGTSMHDVIRFGDKIYCPSVGVMDAEEYKEKYIAFVLQEYIVPPAGSIDPQEYLKNNNEGIEKTARCKSVAKKDLKQGKEYQLFDRRVRYLGEYRRTNGIEGFEIEYLNNSFSEDEWDMEGTNKGDRDFMGYWQFDRIESCE